MASGVKVAKECTIEYEKLKMKKQYSHIIYKLSDNFKEIVVDSHRDTQPDDGVANVGGGAYKELREKLLEIGEAGSCCYASFDLHFKSASGKPKDKVLFIAWAPENAIMKPKMIYTASKDYIKKALAVEIEVQATDEDEISLETLIEKASKNIKD